MRSISILSSYICDVPGFVMCTLNVVHSQCHMNENSLFASVPGVKAHHQSDIQSYQRVNVCQIKCIAPKQVSAFTQSELKLTKI